MRDERQWKPPGLKAPLASAHGRRKVLIIDDHPIFREGLRRVIGNQRDLVVCGEATSVAEGLAAIKSLQPDLAIVDLSLHESNGIDLIKDLQVDGNHLPVVVVSFHEEALYAERCLRAGAHGYVMKSKPVDELLAAIRAAVDGKYHLSDSVTNRILSRIGHGVEGGKEDPVERLSDRELQTFELYGKGRTTRQIAEFFHRSVKTVESHRDRIKEKLGFIDSTTLVRAAVQWVESQDVH
jgi:DNA-binding NarL/FixJ family response regulator